MGLALTKQFRISRVTGTNDVNVIMVEQFDNDEGAYVIGIGKPDDLEIFITPVVLDEENIQSRLTVRWKGNLLKTYTDDLTGNESIFNQQAKADIINAYITSFDR
jgi:hypothetical protein